MSDTIKVLAAEGRSVRMVDRLGQVVAYKRITAEGKYDERTKVTKQGAVEVPATGHYRQLIAEGALVVVED